MTERTFYCVSMVIHDDLRTEMHISTVVADTKPENTSCSTSRADYYKDYFDTKEEAEKFYRDNL